MDPYTSQIMISSRLDELRAEGARSRAARTTRRAATEKGLGSRLMALTFGWRKQRIETPVAGHDRRPTASRPA